MTNKLELKSAKAHAETYTLGIATDLYDTELKRESFTRAELFTRLTTHKVVGDKNKSQMFVQGNIRRVGKSKDAKNIKDIQLFVGDFDNEKDKQPIPKSSPEYVSMADAVEILSATPYAAIVHSSYRHMTIEDTDKGRFVIPLAEPYILDAQHTPELWKAISALIMKDLKFPQWDESGDRPTQAFFFPSCPSAYEHKRFPKKEEDGIINPDGELLDWRPYEKKARLNMTVTHFTTVVQEEEALVYEHIDCRLFLKVFPDFDLQAAHEQGSIDPAVEGKECRAVLCPFDDEHHDPDPSPTRTVVYNRSKMKDKPWGWHCLGGECANRTNEQYLYQSLQNGVLKIASLEDQTLGGGKLDALKTAAEDVNDDTPPEQIEELLRISSIVNSMAEQIKLKKIVAAAHNDYSATDLNKIDAARKVEEKEEADRLDAMRQAKTVNAHEHFIAECIDEYNEKYAYLRYGESSVAVLVQEHGKDSFMDTGSFKKYYGNDFVQFEDDTVDKYEVWTGADRKIRRHFDGVEFEPFGYEKEDRTPDYIWNTFKGFTAVEPVEGDWSLGRKHILETVCSGNEEHFNWLMAWFAQMLQEPEQKTGVSVTLFSKALGTGKTLVSDWMAAILGDYSTKISNNKHLTGNFNRHLEHCILLQNEESSYSGDIQGRGTIRNLITGETVQIERKGMDAIEVRNFVRVLTTTNNTRGIDVVEDERRHFVLEVNDHHAQDRKHFGHIVEQMKTKEALSAMMYDLVTLDYSKPDLGTAPKTEALADQFLANAPSDIAWTYQALSEGKFSSDLNPRSEEELLNSVKIFNDDTYTEVGKDAMYAAYIAYAKLQRKETTGNIVFFRNFYKLGGAPKASKVKGKRIYMVKCPSLHDMRAKFKQIYGKTVVDGTGQGS